MDHSERPAPLRLPETLPGEQESEIDSLLEDVLGMWVNAVNNAYLSKRWTGIASTDDE